MVNEVFKIDKTTSIYEKGEPLGYPNRLHDSPVLLSGEYCYEIGWRWPDGESVVRGVGDSVNEYLIARGSAAIENRIAQVAFGANRDLINIAWKLKNYSDDAEGAVSEDVIVLPGLIHDADVVACNVGYWGYIYAALLMHRRTQVDRPYLEGVSVPVAILLLDEGQMCAMHKSEGVIKSADEERPMVNCNVAMVDTELPGKRTVSAQLYSLSLPFLSFDGIHPVGFNTVDTCGRNGDYLAMDQTKMFENIIRRMRLGMSVDEVVAAIRAGGEARKNGLCESVDENQKLYEQMREFIIKEISLQDADGVRRRGCEGMNNILSIQAAWAFRNTLGEQVINRDFQTGNMRLEKTG